jgi:endonuclease/exonuclease/phosphatase family metal-dependent hydrolase
MQPSISRNVSWLVLLLALVALVSPAWAASDDAQRAGQIRAMTQNLYIGAEVLSIAQAPGLCELMAAADAAVEQVLANDFSQRAETLARLIAAENPEVVGLQEVFQVILSDPQTLTPFYFDDYLGMLLAALSAEGANYYAAQTRMSTPITVPADSDDDCDPLGPSLAAADYFGTIVDRDVIICREDVACAGGAAANFQFNASADTPGGPIVIERGWVSTVATVKGREYRIVNTHLEVSGNASFRIVQSLQALEFGATLDFLSADGRPQVVLGDFNSDDAPGPVDCGGFQPCFSGYEVMVAAGFADAWLAQGRNAGDGFTCCQDADLRNAESAHSERIDQVWARAAVDHFGRPEVRGVRARVLGAEQDDRSHPDGLWPSDHAGVSADLVLRTRK